MGTILKKYIYRLNLVNGRQVKKTSGSRRKGSKQKARRNE